MKTLGEIFEIGSGGTPSKTHPEYYDGNIPWIKTGDLKDEYLYSVEDCISKEGLNNSSAKMYPSGTVLIAMYGATIGATSILKFDACTNQACAAFKPCEEVLPEYLYYFLRSKKQKFISDGVGGAQPNISAGYLKKVSIDIRNIKEQEKIVTVLDKLNGIIQKRQNEVDELDELIKARFVELFGDYFKSHINEKELDEVCDFIDYRGKTPEKSEEGIPLITAKNVKNNKFFIDPQEFIPEENYDDVMTRGIPRVNDVLFTTEAPLGNVCRIPDVYEKFCVGQRLITMQPHEDIINSEYLEYALASPEFQDKMWQKSSGSTVKGIRSKLLVLLTIPVPPMTIQEEFKNILHQVDKSKFIYEMTNEGHMSTETIIFIVTIATFILELVNAYKRKSKIIRYCFLQNKNDYLLVFWNASKEVIEKQDIKDFAVISGKATTVKTLYSNDKIKLKIGKIRKCKEHDGEYLHDLSFDFLCPDVGYIVNIINHGSDSKIGLCGRIKKEDRYSVRYSRDFYWDKFSRFVDMLKKPMDYMTYIYSIGLIILSCFVIFVYDGVFLDCFGFVMSAAGVAGMIDLSKYNHIPRLINKKLKKEYKDYKLVNDLNRLYYYPIVN